MLVIKTISYDYGRITCSDTANNTAHAASSNAAYTSLNQTHGTATRLRLWPRAAARTLIGTGTERAGRLCGGHGFLALVTDVNSAGGCPGRTGRSTVSAIQNVL